MRLQAQHGRGLFRRGYTLVELIAALVMVVTVLAMIMGTYTLRIKKAKLDKTLQEMMSLAQASLDFYRVQGYWPMTTGDLAPNYMYTGIAVSPFGGAYQLTGLHGAISVSTLVPQGLPVNGCQGSLFEIAPQNGQDIIRITQAVPNEFSGRLDYENKYLYRQ